MPIFQYQQLFEPLVPITPPAAPPLSWLPIYPAMVPHRKPQTAPSFFYGNPSNFPPPEVRESQAAVEVLTAYTAPLVRESQAAVEVVTQYLIGLRRVRLSQAAVEIVYPFTCATFVPPLPASCPESLPIDPSSAPCADVTPSIS
jgi:hypothetical protein